MTAASIQCAPGSDRHRAFGLVLGSVWPLPELMAAEAGGAVDIEVVESTVPAELAGAVERGVRFEAAPGRLLLRVDNVANYLAVDGGKILVQRMPGADLADVRAFLLTVVMGAVLQQRGDLVLHGSAIEVPGAGAVMFLGRSGAGKSTMAAEFRRRGYPVLTDDLCVVRPDASGCMMVQAGIPHLKLWADSLAQLGLGSEGLQRVRQKIEKRILPIAENFVSEARLAGRVFVLTPSERKAPVLEELSGTVKFEVFRNHTYRHGFLAGSTEKAQHFRAAMGLAGRVPVHAALRARAGFDLTEFANLIEATWKK